MMDCNDEITVQLRLKKDRDTHGDRRTLLHSSIKQHPFLIHNMKANTIIPPLLGMRKATDKGPSPTKSSQTKPTPSATKPAPSSTKAAPLKGASDILKQPIILKVQSTTTVCLCGVCALTQIIVR